MKAVIRSLKILPVAILASGLPFLDAAADRFSPDGSYNPDIPTAGSVLGFELGDRPSRYEEIVRYCEALSAASPRVSLQRYARSYEKRDLLLMIITSGSNHARLTTIQQNIDLIADPRRSLPTSELADLIADTPAIAYMAYAIHGDELSSSDAALRVAYELAAGQSQATRDLLDNLVVLVDPTENPDGRERILSMIASYQGSISNPDPDALSHAGFWPWGRGNHYLFDLNRDWFAQVHPESRGRAGILSKWHPQLVVDSHEMGFSSTYLFSPPRDPFNPNWPSSTLEWWEQFASDQAAAFDEHGWSYFTREWNEEFYPGYGSALAIYSGAVGMLYEQASTDGQPVRKPSGRIESYFNSSHHHYASSIANLTTLSTHREEILRAYREARREAISRGQSGSIRSFYFAPTPDPARAHALAERLRGLGIEVDQLPEGATLRGARDFWQDGSRSVSLPAGSYRVRLDQPEGNLARVILEPHILMSDSSLAKEREHLERQKSSRIYDVTAWSFLLASGCDAWWASSLDGLSWRPVTSFGPAGGQLLGGTPRYGWLFEGAADHAIVLAARMVNRGFKVRASQEPFVFRGKRYLPGTFLLRIEDNPSDVADSLAVLVKNTNLEIIPIASGRILDGPDLGGDKWPLIQEARVAIAAGPGLSTYSVGAAWHVLDSEFGLRTSLVDVTRLANIGLDRYNVLVLPNSWQGGAAYKRIVDKKGLDAVRVWVEGGGTLIGIGGGAEFVADSTSKLSLVRTRTQSLDDFPPPEYGLDRSSIEKLERMQSMGLGQDGKPVDSAGLYPVIDRQEVLMIPGAGSPLLGPGTWAMLGAAGEAARRRGAPQPAKNEKTDDSRISSDKKGAESKPKLSDEEKKAARKKMDARLRRFAPSGAILRVDLDPENWIAYGCGDRVAVMFRRVESLLARDPVQTVGRFATPADMHLGGLLWPEAAGRISQTAYVTREAKNKGQIILFAFDPNFRGYFWGSRRLFLNAALLGPGLGTTQTVQW